ncbi:SCO family protein [Pseudomarimonas salicorniae]|uniref:SCO family protein n=1 Tax=Pseudomarimonas salicorniae TaxID=2933270 RepID=A0ABT0GJE8_9GAMM|nr:SCO family protein [Lysobacter sp. CAU 1642]MCK7594669.1 SCO family protein [Lysobacter sp. CAU 1642]
MNNRTRTGGSAKLSFLAILAAALAAGLGLWLSQRTLAPDAATPRIEGLQGTLVYPQPRPVPAFALDGPDGAKVGSEQLAGRWNIVFVGFTHCPDICPTTLSTLGQATKPFADRAPAERPQVLFVSVDPERDSPETAAEYARFFGNDFLAATADHERLLPFTRSLGMVYMQTPVEGGDYTVDHSSSLAVIDPEGRLVAVMRPPLDPQKIAADLALLMQAGA